MQRKALLNPDTPENIKINLAKHGFEVIIIPFCGTLSRSVAGHPDLQFFTDDEKVFCRPKTPLEFIRRLEQCGADVIVCENEPEEKYPHDIAYNIACTGLIAFHRTDKTDARILAYLKSKNVTVYNVSQGYSRCSTVITGDQQIITADKGIRDTAARAKADTLLIKSGYIKLPGYKYGFIGGTSGTFEDKVFFTGNINLHPDGQQITQFIEEGGKQIVCLSNDELLDTGSILFF